MAKVLLIEGNREVREMFTILVENGGFDVIGVDDCKEGRDKLSKEGFSAVIASAPRAEILWFLGVVRASHNISISTIPILVVLEDSNDSPSDYVEAGASKCLSKFPASGEKLVEDLRSIQNLPRIQPKVGA